MRAIAPAMPLYGIANIVWALIATPKGAPISTPAFNQMFSAYLVAFLAVNMAILMAAARREAGARGR